MSPIEFSSRPHVLVADDQADVLEALPARQREALIEALGELVQGRLAEAAECAPPLRRREPR